MQICNVQSAYLHFLIQIGNAYLYKISNIHPADIHFFSLADAIEQGALRDKDITLPPSLFEAIDKEAPNIRADILYTLIAYYIANRQPDTDWVVLPVSNFDAYFGTTSFSRKILNTLPETVLVRDRSTCGVSRYKVAEKVLSLMEDV